MDVVVCVDKNISKQSAVVATRLAEIFCTGVVERSEDTWTEEWKKHGAAGAKIFVEVAESATVLRHLVFRFFSTGLLYHLMYIASRGNEQLLNPAQSTTDYPELIFSNFSGQQHIADLAESLQTAFPVQPDFEHREALVFTHSDGYVFVRRYRYLIDRNKKDVMLQEIGPQLSLFVILVRRGDEELYRVSDESQKEVLRKTGVARHGEYYYKSLPYYYK